MNNRKDPIPILPGMFLGYVHPSGEVHIEESGEWDACPGKYLCLFVLQQVFTLSQAKITPANCASWVRSRKYGKAMKQITTGPMVKWRWAAELRGKRS